MNRDNFGSHHGRASRMTYESSRAWPASASRRSGRPSLGAGSPLPESNIIVTENDVLSGRGVATAEHPGNIRFRTLVQSRYDPNYCAQYTPAEKKAVATEIVSHIQALDPPGRFLKRYGKGKSRKKKRSDDMPLQNEWEELSHEESVKKTVQALRDCNRPDRTGYAMHVSAPEDVLEKQQALQGVSLIDRARQALARQASPTATASEEIIQGNKRVRPPKTVALASSRGSFSNSAGQDADWAKRQRLGSYYTPVANGTPTTAASSGGSLRDASLLHSPLSEGLSIPNHHGARDHDGVLPPLMSSEQSHTLSPSLHPMSAPAVSAYEDHDHLESGFEDPFLQDGSDNDAKPAASTEEDTGTADLDPLQLASDAIQRAHEFQQQYGSFGANDVGLSAIAEPLDDDVDFPPPSPFHPDDDQGSMDQHHFDD